MLTFINTKRFTFSLKFRGWVRWYHLTECGCSAFQIGGFIVEIINQEGE